MFKDSTETYIILLKKRRSKYLQILQGINKKIIV